MYIANSEAPRGAKTSTTWHKYAVELRASFAEADRFTAAIAEEVVFGAAKHTLAFHLDFLDTRRVERELAFDTFAGHDRRTTNISRVPLPLRAITIPKIFEYALCSLRESSCGRRRNRDFKGRNLFSKRRLFDQFDNLLIHDTRTNLTRLKLEKTLFIGIGRVGKGLLAATMLGAIFLQYVL